MPPHKLNLKFNCRVMLLRNLCSKKGLCNGMRLCPWHLFICSTLWDTFTGSHSGQQVLIRKLKLAPFDINLPFTLQSIQFPVCLSNSMTINKSQGQTFNQVGIYLWEPVFLHGQRYVAFSQVRTLSGVKVLRKMTASASQRMLYTKIFCNYGVNILFQSGLIFQPVSMNVEKVME